MLDNDIKSDLLRDTVEPERALISTVNMEVGHQNQQRTWSNNTIVVKAIQQFSRICGKITRTQQRNRNAFNCEADGLSRNCGQNWTSTHCQICPALDEKINHCGLLNHFAELRRKKQNINKTTQQGNRINNIESHKNIDNSDNQKINVINYNKKYDSQYDSSDNNYVARLEQNSSNTIKPQTWI